jgi:hypothetical protein
MLLPSSEFGSRRPTTHLWQKASSPFLLSLRVSVTQSAQILTRAFFLTFGLAIE